MVDRNFKEDCRLGLSELLQAVSIAKGEPAVQSCLRHLVDLPDIDIDGTTLKKMDFYLLPYCLRNTTKLFSYVRYLESRDGSRVPYVITMLKLYGYVQCIEVKYIYKVIGNLFGELGGGQTGGRLYDESFSARECFNDIVKRGKCVESSSGKRFGVIDLWSSFLDFDLRNAVGHSDFIIPKGSHAVLIPSCVLARVTGPEEAPSKKGRYTFSEIDKLYSMANDFNEAFKMVIEDHGVNFWG